MKLSVFALALAACAPTLEVPKDEGDGPAPDGVIDASSETEWVSFDLDTAAVVEEADPTWDLGFQRFNVRLHSGVYGEGTVEAAVLDGADYDALETAPADGWLVDLPDEDDDGKDELVFEAWYDYDYETHLLSPADRVYVVHSNEDQYHKIKFLSYYDDAGTPASISFLTAPIAAPEGAP
jgi:hypothetical protein